MYRYWPQAFQGCHDCSYQCSLPENCHKPLQCHKSWIPFQTPRPALRIRGSLLAETAGHLWPGLPQQCCSIAYRSLAHGSAALPPGSGRVEGKEAATSLLGPSWLLGPLTAFPLSFFTLGLTGVYGFGGPYGETVATGTYRAFRVAAAAGHSGAFSGNDSNRTSKFQGGNYTQTPFLRASGNGFLHCTG